MIERTNAPKKRPDASSLVWGRTFTDHMLTIPWTAASGWGAPAIQPYAPLSLDPAAIGLHYAFNIFEGLKAYKGKDGQTRLFRPDMNWRRMNRSAQRLGMPTFSGEAMTQLLCELVRLDAAWVPSEPGYSLYCRPVGLGTSPDLRVVGTADALYYTILSPCGPYYPTGFKPVKLLATTKYARAWPGGTGNVKIGANYCNGIVPAAQAAADGYQQILWLSGQEDEVDEVGVMNAFVALQLDDGKIEIATPALKDVVLPGVTRDSILDLARAHAAGQLPPIEGFPAPDQLVVSERRITMPELVKAAERGKIKEIFGSGTAAIVCPVERIGYKGHQIEIPLGPGDIGPITKAAYREIVGRQLGEIPSEWTVVA